ncbi:MAG: NAD(P)H-dependent oxidoreductase [Zoogloeaceae bacterium]|jgi:FMN reductase|nr:NAD(P)H-dependent oxidoreductase [Zoogloeaceae bacterium]
MSFNIVGISGSLDYPSRATTLVRLALAQSVAILGGSSEFISIVDLVPELGQSTDPTHLPPKVQAAQQTLGKADLLVVASPIYTASYSGLLQHFFDLLDPLALQGKTAILAATGGSGQLALTLEYQLRPLLSFFGVHTAPTTLFAHDKHFLKDINGDYTLTDSLLRERIEQALAETARLLTPLARFA